MAALGVVLYLHDPFAVCFHVKHEGGEALNLAVVTVIGGMSVFLA
jgi:hypothetical protein